MERSIRWRDAGSRAALAGVALASLVAPLALASGAASAVDGIVVPLETVSQGAEGAVVPLAVRSVDPSLVGRSCSASYEADNNGSVHPGTDLLVSSGDQMIILSDVEAAPGAVTTGSGELVLGSTVTVAVRIGADGMASLGASLSIVCAAPATTAPTVTTVPEPTVATAQPPVPSSIAPSSTQSSTAPQQSASSAPPATDSTTTAVASAGVAPSTTRASVASGTLPATGTDVGWTLVLGSLALCAGLLVRRAHRADA